MRGRPARGLAAASVPKVATRVALAGALVAVLLLSGCDTVRYYAQSVNGHLSVMAQACRWTTPSPTRAPPTTYGWPSGWRWPARSVPMPRANSLPDNGSYRRYADLHRSFVV